MPVGIKESIVEVDFGGSDKVISKNIVIVPAFDNKHWCTGEFTSEAEELIKGGISFVQKVVVSLVVFFRATPDDDVRVRERANVS